MSRRGRPVPGRSATRSRRSHARWERSNSSIRSIASAVGRWVVSVESFRRAPLRVTRVT
ncbi:MAG: hypothetical protein U0104_00020 [Gemmatimonadales bacterium]